MHNRDSFVDRRSGTDRRKLYDLQYFMDDDFTERRIAPERRGLGERRTDWIQIGKWYSVSVVALGLMDEKPGSIELSL